MLNNSRSLSFFFAPFFFLLGAVDSVEQYPPNSPLAKESFVTMKAPITRSVPLRIATQSVRRLGRDLRAGRLPGALTHAQMSSCEDSAIRATPALGPRVLGARKRRCHS